MDCGALVARWDTTHARGGDCLDLNPMTTRPPPTRPPATTKPEIRSFRTSSAPARARRADPGWDTICRRLLATYLSGLSIDTPHRQR
jgi:hypothetical protein